MGEHAALRAAGRAGRVDDQRRLVGRDGGRAPLQLRRVAPAAPQRRQRVRPGAVDQHDLAQPGQPVADLRHLRRLPRVGADDHHGARVAEHPLALLGGARWVDRHDDRARERDAQLDLHPLRARVGQHADAVAGPDAEVDEAERDRRADVAQPGVGQVVPGAVTEEALCGPVAVALRRDPRQRGDRLGQADVMRRHAVPFAEGAAAGVRPLVGGVASATSSATPASIPRASTCRSGTVS